MSDTRDIVERITKEVIKRLETNTASAPGISKPLISQEKILVVLTACDDYVTVALEQLQVLCRAGCKLTLVLSSAISRTLSDEDIKRYLSPDRIIRGDISEGYSPDFPGKFSRVFVPLLSVNTASQVAQYLSIRVPAHIILRSLVTGVPVVAASDTFLPSDAVAPAASKITSDIVNKLSGLGISLVELKDSANNILNGKKEAVNKISEQKSSKSGYETLYDAGADRVGTAGEDVPAEMKKNIACMIDHTLLKPASKERDVIKLCEEAKKYLFASVCINPGYVALASEQLKGTPVKVCTVVGFPLGATTTMTKVNETRDAIANGADEIDMVINIGELKSGRDDVVLNDIKEVVTAAGGRLVKVILETALLSDEEKVRACLLVKQAGADFVKTSTGFSSGGATVEDIQLMRRTVGPDMGVKASGGIRNIETAVAMRAAGATRIGASASISITGGLACKR